MKNKLTFYSLLTILLVTAARAGDPPLTSSPVDEPKTNQPPVQRVHQVPQRAERQQLQSTNNPPPLPVSSTPTPIYIVPRIKWVQTPQGIIPLIPERNWADLIALFPSIDQTNFVFYSTLPK